MAKVKIHIDPVTRIEGHLKAEVTVENGKVVDAHITAAMYRGFESILKGRDPLDASQITQRICGVCPTSHAIAASVAVEQATETKIPYNAVVTRNLIQAANCLQSHILHFYHLAGQDFIQGPDTAPFAPRFEYADLRLDPATNQIGVDEYLEALEVRRSCHSMVALLAGRMPHLHGVVAGGATQIPSQETIADYKKRMQNVRKFIEEKYIPMVYTISAHYRNLFDMAHGTKNCMCVGAYPKENGEMFFEAGTYINGKDAKFDVAGVTEDLRYSWFKNINSGGNFRHSTNETDVNKSGAYSFAKGLRYQGHAMEVGPHARMWIGNKPLSPMGQALAKKTFNMDVKNMRDLGIDMVFSIMGRHLARAEECYQLIEIIEYNLDKLQFGEEVYTKVKMKNGEGLAFTEAPRGSLIHYIDIKDGLINNYQLIPATLWNCAPRDDAGKRGPVEQALIGVPMVDGSAVNVARVIRAYDP